jgi:hypothetical protein
MVSVSLLWLPLLLLILLLALTLDCVLLFLSLLFSPSPGPPTGSLGSLVSAIASYLLVRPVTAEELRAINEEDKDEDEDEDEDEGVGGCVSDELVVARLFLLFCVVKVNGSLLNKPLLLLLLL